MQQERTKPHSEDSPIIRNHLYVGIPLAARAYRLWALIAFIICACITAYTLGYGCHTDRRTLWLSCH